MNLDRVTPGAKAPDEINVIIEFPAHSDPVKYEVDHDTGAMFVDRILLTAMHYPANYGYIPNTLSNDGDPCDVMVTTAFPLIPGSVIRCRPVAVLQMTDESGDDAKVIAVPVDKITKRWSHVKGPEDMPQELMDRIAHFFHPLSQIAKKAVDSLSKSFGLTHIMMVVVADDLKPLLRHASCGYSTEAMEAILKNLETEYYPTGIRDELFSDKFRVTKHGYFIPAEEWLTIIEKDPFSDNPAYYREPGSVRTMREDPNEWIEADSYLFEMRDNAGSLLASVTPSLETGDFGVPGSSGRTGRQGG